MIKLKNINKTFQIGTQKISALKNINLHISQGDIFGIVGHSGAGKSSLIRLINRLEIADSGEIWINKHNINHYSNSESLKAIQKIAMIFQTFNLLETKTVYQNIEIPLILAKIPRHQRHQKILTLLKYVDLEDKINFYPHALSGGQKQRVGIARALANDPSILLCDEATSALDPENTLSILNLLKQINLTQNITIIIVTHEMEVIKTICNKMAVIDNGIIIETGKTIDLFRNPQHKITKNFVNSLLQQNLPAKIMQNFTNKIKTANICRLEFIGQTANQPIINNLLKQVTIDIEITILFANMIEIDGEVIGSMFVLFQGQNDSIARAVSYLKQQGVRINQGNNNV